MERPCAIKDCPVLAVRHLKTCALHEKARTAKDLGISKDFRGNGGKKCLGCRRAFAEGDYVWSEMERRPHMKKGGEQFGHRHVACEPVSVKLSKKKIRESVKTLLEAAL